MAVSFRLQLRLRHWLLSLHYNIIIVKYWVNYINNPEMVIRQHSASARQRRCSAPQTSASHPPIHSRTGSCCAARCKVFCSLFFTTKHLWTNKTLINTMRWMPIATNCILKKLAALTQQTWGWSCSGGCAIFTTSAYTDQTSVKKTFDTLNLI